MNILIRNVESRYSTRGDCLPSLNRGPSGAVRLPFLIGVCKINLNQFCGHQLGTIEAHFEFIALYHFLTNDREPIRPIFSIGSGGFDALGCENFPPKISDFFFDANVIVRRIYRARIVKFSGTSSMDKSDYFGQTFVSLSKLLPKT